MGYTLQLQGLISLHCFDPLSVKQPWGIWTIHYDDVRMGAIASQITSLTIVYSIVHSNADQRKHQRSASLAFVWGIHRGPVNSPHKWPVTRKIFPFDDVIMYIACHHLRNMTWQNPVHIFMGYTLSLYNHDDTMHSKTRCIFHGIYLKSM